MPLFGGRRPPPLSAAQRLSLSLRLTGSAGTLIFAARGFYVREKRFPEALGCAPLFFSVPQCFLFISLLRSDRKSGLVLPCAMGNAVV